MANGRSAGIQLAGGFTYLGNVPVVIENVVDCLQIETLLHLSEGAVHEMGGCNYCYYLGHFVGNLCYLLINIISS